ncbi:MAG TPA: di-heme oxidoredictase family protein [Thermoanaerobaculia bacterium]|jgi:hypothetical protein|nr:di-heme oxidoredictase family protein [Thermoanaerobaculia bacterium]
MTSPQLEVTKMKRACVAALFCCLLSPAIIAKRRAVAPPPPTEARVGQPIAGLPSELLVRFFAGREEFNKRQDLDDGLGPVMNGMDCLQCHSVPAPGGAGVNGSSVIRFGKITNGVFDPLERLGGPLVQHRGIQVNDGAPLAFRGETVPPEATIIAIRRPTTVLGLSLVEATPDTTFIALAAEQAARNDGTAGRVAMVDNLAAGMKTVGKFGWKAQTPTLHQFAGEAYLNEIGVTSPFFPKENCPRGRCEDLRFNPRPGLNDNGEDTQKLTDFMAMLAPPPRGAITPDVVAGEAVFNRIGCNSCHVSTLRTGPNPLEALDEVTYHPFSDFLLHDMGPLNDRIVQADASGSEMRTPPLWGLRFLDSFLHDGRAGTIEAAIVAHEGQGRGARDRFHELNDGERAQLMAFLRSL